MISTWSSFTTPIGEDPRRLCMVKRGTAADIKSCGAQLLISVNLRGCSFVVRIVGGLLYQISI